MEPLLDANQLAALLGVKRDWVYQHRDEIGYVAVGKRIRFDRRALDRYVSEHTTAPKCRAGRPRKQQRRIVRRIAWEGEETTRGRRGNGDPR